MRPTVDEVDDTIGKGGLRASLPGFSSAVVDRVNGVNPGISRAKADAQRASVSYQVTNSARKLYADCRPRRTLAKFGLANIQPERLDPAVGPLDTALFNCFLRIVHVEGHARMFECGR